MSDLSAQLDRIAEIAFVHEPDWDAVFEGAGHDWCGQASRAVAAYLNEQGVGARVVTGGLRGWHHTWVTLDDGTIIDPTIDQYIDRTEDVCVDHREVPWAEGGHGDLVAVIAPEHPFHAEYHAPSAG